MEVTKTFLSGVFILHPKAHRDSRGQFAEAFNASILAQHELPFRVDQVNVSMSQEEGTVRGMHWQEDPLGQIKIVRCIAGEVLDVVVDVRPSSSTYGQYYPIWLQEGDLQSVYVPKGCAHGWQAIKKRSEIEYLVSGSWNKEAERGLRPDDPAIQIIWAKTPTCMNPRDMSWPLFKP